MGLANDPIFVQVSSHTQCSDGSTRNDVFYMTGVLNAYQAQLANNLATPLYNMMVAELIAAGGTLSISQSTPFIAGYGTPAGGNVSLRAAVGVGLQPLATPNRYHMVKQDVFTYPTATPLGSLGVSGQLIYNWIDGILQKMTSQNLYTGAPYTNG